jgi:hypothetical protein
MQLSTKKIQSIKDKKFNMFFCGNTFYLFFTWATEDKDQHNLFLFFYYLTGTDISEHTVLGVLLQELIA